MRPLDAVRVALCLVAVIALGACGIGSKKVDYKSASQLPPLDVPPDLTRPGGADDRYTIPDINPKGGTTFSEYNRDRTTQRTGSSAVGVLPQQDNARIVRDGSQRWLVVKGSPDQVWPVVKDFWQEAGLIVNIEVPEAGVMETDWAESRAHSLPDPGWFRYLMGKVMELVYSTSQRDKFRTRLERGAEPGTTEIYVSHRGMEEVYITSEQEKTMWQPRPPDPGLEAEMLGRLMARFGVDAPRAKVLVASPTAIPLRAKLASGPDGAGLLALDEQFDRAWRRVGLALDRVGFTVEDRDRTKGLYFVRYIDPQIDNKSADDKGLFSWLKFWDSSDKTKPGQQFSIEVKDAAQGCQVKVLGKDGAQETSQTAGRILALLYDQLK